jgi:hypothetical protein
MSSKCVKGVKGSKVLVFGVKGFTVFGVSDELKVPRVKVAQGFLS